MIGDRVRVAKRVAKRACLNIEYMRDFNNDDRMVGRLRKTRVPCSCFMCGHRRKWEGETIQERKLRLAESDG